MSPKRRNHVETDDKYQSYMSMYIYLYIYNRAWVQGNESSKRQNHADADIFEYQ
jgi:hypothetical protein